MSTENVELARAGYDALMRGDLDAVAAMLDPDVKWHGGDPTVAGACTNRAQALAFMQRPERRGPGRLVDVVDAGERVVVITQPPPEDGEPSPLHAQVTTFRDGRVVEMLACPTLQAALASAGVTWSAAGAPDATS